MVNGMGGTPLSELSIVAKYLNQQFQEHDIAAKQWFVGDYMTSLDMQGFSITVVPYSEDIEKVFSSNNKSLFLNKIEIMR